MMRGLRGIDISLYISENSTVTVSNVLVGDPSDGKFTLAIPKGDDHDWLDAKVGFFGRTFRTIGYPEEGIEENMPLSWNKQIRVMQLMTNGDITVYEKNTFKRHSFKGVQYVDNRGSIVNKTGELTRGNVEINVYACNVFDTYLPKIGDIVVGSDCEFEFDTTSQQTVSESLKTFRATYPDFSVINSVTQTMNAVRSDYLIIAG